MRRCDRLFHQTNRRRRSFLDCVRPMFMFCSIISWPLLSRRPSLPALALGTRRWICVGESLALMMANDVGPERALIFRITHRDNLTWILQHGLHCRGSQVRDPNFVPIGNQELIDRRRAHPVRCRLGGTLSDYVPFYFTPHSPMFYNINTGYRNIAKRNNEEIAIIVSSIPHLRKNGVPFVFTDRHAVLNTAQIFDDERYLDQLDWDILRQRDFRRDPEDPTKVERYEAEALIHKHLPISGLLGLACYDDTAKRTIGALAEKCGVNIKIAIKATWYF